MAEVTLIPVMTWLANELNPLWSLILLSHQQLFRNGKCCVKLNPSHWNMNKALVTAIQAHARPKHVPPISSNSFKCFHFKPISLKIIMKLKRNPFFKSLKIHFHTANVPTATTSSAYACTMTIHNTNERYDTRQIRRMCAGTGIPTKNQKFCFERKHLQQCSNNYILRSLANFTENVIPWTGTANYYWQVISKLLFVVKMNHFVDKLNIKTSAHNHSCLMHTAHRAEPAAKDICSMQPSV